MIVTFVFCIADIEKVIIESTSVFPYVGVFQATTGSTAGATTMTALLVALTCATCLSTLAAASRQAWSFGRDEGLPFSAWFRKVSTLNDVGRNANLMFSQITTLGVPIPLNAIWVSLTITIVLSFINLGSTAAFNSIVGLLAGSGGFAYFISIGCVLLKRIRGEELPVGRWSLGRLAIPVNAFALC